MALFESDAIILRSYDLSDADRIVVMLTADHGLIRAVAKGSKRSKSKFGSSLEFLSITSVAYAQKESQELAGLRSVELQWSSFSLASDPAVLQDMSHLTELLLSMTPAQEPNEKLFRLVKAVVVVLAEDTGKVFALRPYFKVWLLRLAGYLPDLNRCDVCGTRIADDAESDITAASQIICGQCIRSKDKLRSGALKIARYLLKQHPGVFCRQISGAVPAELSSLEGIADRLLEGALGKPFGTIRGIRSLSAKELN
ncbi:MAG: DNA repair protein RecO [Acidobacteriota bacterium]|nr:MAG: DNA repair protein RecO [Acidobacteriota bacterium]